MVYSTTVVEPIFVIRTESLLKRGGPVFYHQFQEIPLEFLYFFRILNQGENNYVF